jgi:predicted transcriptional regulator
VCARVVAVRSAGIRKEPALLAMRAYPSALSDLLAESNIQPYLITIVIINRKYRDLVSDYLDGKVGEYELKGTFVRLTEEYERALMNVLASLDITFLVRESEEDLKILEKVLSSIGKYGTMDAFTKQLLRGIVKRSARRVKSCRKILRIISLNIEERISEINSAIEYTKKAHFKGLLSREEVGNKLRELAREYSKYVRARRELNVLALSMNLGLTGTTSTLLRLEEKAEEVKELQARLTVGEITSNEFTEKLNEIISTINNLKSDLATELKNFETLEKIFEENAVRIAEIFDKDSLELLRKMFNSSKRSAKRIAEIYMCMRS